MTDIKPGIYQHYQGEQYRVFGVGKHEETHEGLVLYEALYDNPVSKLWARPIAAFLENVEVNGKIMPRFTLIKEE